MSTTKVDTNKYRIFISDGFNLDGSRRRYSKTVTTDLTGRDLKRFLLEEEFKFEDEVKKKSPKFQELSRGPFEKYAIWWLDYKNITGKTRQNYENFLNLRILPVIRDKIVNKLNAGDMIELMKIIEETPSERTGKPLSVKSIKHYHTLLRTMFNDAVKLKIVDENPMAAVPVTSPKSKFKGNYYDIEDINKMLRVLPGEPIKYQLATLLAISTGVRLGELTALQWKHMDVDNCVITVEQTNSYSNKKTEVKKEFHTKTSLREVTFPIYLVDLIEAHRESEKIKKDLVGCDWFYGDNEHEEDFVFTQKNGKIIFVDTISGWFRKFRRRNNLKDINFHGLRHTSTTILISNGINVSNISSRLGHSRTSTTTDFYAHALKDIEKESANIFGNMFGKKESGTKSGSEKDSIRVIK